VLVLFVFGSLILLLDQGSKALLLSRLLQPSFSVAGIVQFRCVINRNRFYRWPGTRIALAVTWCAALGSAVALHSGGVWVQSSLAMAGLGCALGGAAGNLADVLRCQSVVDFIDLGWWPVFNIADLGIIFGLMVAFWP
jgi:signal peptidase II